MNVLERKIVRNTVEKNRRMHMKNLCLQLAALIPKPEYFSKDIMSQYNLLDQAVTYILKLKERIEILRKRKGFNNNDNISDRGIDEMSKLGFKLPVIEVRDQDQNLEILLISKLEKRIALHEIIGILEEEGAEVVNANFSIVGKMIFYTIHSQAISSRIGLEASMVYMRLHQLIA